MTTLNHYQGVAEILQQLDIVRLRRRTLRLLAGAAAAITLAASVLLTASAAAGYWPDQPPAFLRWFLLGLVAAVLVFAVGWFVVRALLWRQNPAQTARFVEQSIPDLRNDLINSVLLAGDTQQASPELVQEAIRETVRETRQHDIRQCVPTRPLRRWGVAAAVAVAMLAAFAVLQPRAFSRGLLAVAAPTRYVPTAGQIDLLSLEPGDVTKFAGEQVTVVVRVRNDGGRKLPAELFLAASGEARPMLASEDNSVFTCPLGAAEQSYRYAVRIGDSRWPADRPWFSVTVIQRAEVQGLDVQYDYPSYTGLASRTVRNFDGAIEAPIGSRATVTLRLSAPVPLAVLEVQGQAPLPMQPRDARTFEAAVPVDADGAYRLLLKDAAGRTMQQLPDIASEESPKLDAYGAAGQTLMNGYYRIHAVPDKPPSIAFVQPNHDVSVPPGGELRTRIRISDDYGLTAAQFFLGREGPELKSVHNYDLKGKREGEFDYTVKLDAGLKEGDVLVYYATATDNRALPSLGGAQTSATGRFKITVQDAAKVTADRARRFEELRNRLMEILRLQETQRVGTEICWKKHTELKQVTSAGAAIAEGQRQIRSELADLAAKFPFDPEMATIQQAVALLAGNEAQTAVDQAQVLAALPEMTRRGAACGMLAATQDKIIDVLQTLLAIMPSLANKAAGEKATSRPSELSPEAKEKLAELKKDLDQFLDEQRKVIEASERLAKKPVDAFTSEDDKLLKDLQTFEDKWDKFLKEAFTDFSKLAGQDFSNPAMLKELMEVKTDVTMAKDALKEKASEIATTAGEASTESAKTLRYNIEKWLLDEPDRKKWVMEDTTGQINAEQAELPTELEDLVGDLLEEEEDLFDEMEDPSSKYMNADDKGIGWGAEDGPISNMNAQGVTGNQLPNDNELSGRSGEGRTGKSNGEMVEDKATGKDGRRTPSRLSQDPFQKGTVKDESKEPAGGATGGGKVSGWGGEGLEGPLPPKQAQDEMKRLAGKQATIINKAERLNAAFNQNDYAGFQFLQAITLMNRVQTDLQNFHYRNALRSKDSTIGAIKQSKLLLSGQIDVAADSSANMPKYVRDDVADAMKGKLPAEYNEVLQQYYRRLSEQTPGK